MEKQKKSYVRPEVEFVPIKVEERLLTCQFAPPGQTKGLDACTGGLAAQYS